MNIKDEIDAVLSGSKELGSELQTGLVNALGNPTLAQILFDLLQSHVEVAKIVQQTPPGQAALVELRKKQAAAAARAQPAPAPAAPAVVDTAAIAAQVLAQLLPLLKQQTAPPVPDENTQA